MTIKLYECIQALKESGNEASKEAIAFLLEAKEQLLSETKPGAVASDFTAKIILRAKKLLKEHYQSLKEDKYLLQKLLKDTLSYANNEVQAGTPKKKAFLDAIYNVLDSNGAPTGGIRSVLATNDYAAKWRNNFFSKTMQKIEALGKRNEEVFWEEVSRMRAGAKEPRGQYDLDFRALLNEYLRVEEEWIGELVKMFDKTPKTLRLLENHLPVRHSREQLVKYKKNQWLKDFGETFYFNDRKAFTKNGKIEQIFADTNKVDKNGKNLFNSLAENMYNKIVARNLKPLDDEDLVIGHKVAKPRNPDALMEYIKKYSGIGPGGFKRYLWEHQNNLIKRYSLARVFGKKPSKNFQEFLDKMRKIYAHDTNETLDTTWAERQWKHFDGSLSYIEAPNVYFTEQFARSFATYVFLGKTVVTAMMGDWATSFFANRRLGMRFENIGKYFNKFYFNKQDRELATQHYFTAKEAVLALVSRHVGGIENMEGRFEQFTSGAIRWFGLSSLTDNAKIQFAHAMTQEIARFSKISWGELGQTNPRFRRGLIEGGFTLEDWNAINKITPEEIKDGKLKGYLISPATIEKAQDIGLLEDQKRELAFKLYSMIRNHSQNIAVIHANLHTRTAMGNWLPKGSWVGLGVRSVTSLFSFPIQMFNIHFRNLIVNEIRKTGWSKGLQEAFIVASSLYATAFIANLLSDFLFEGKTEWNFTNANYQNPAWKAIMDTIPFANSVYSNWKFGPTYGARISSVTDLGSSAVGIASGKPAKALDTLEKNITSHFMVAMFFKGLLPKIIFGMERGFIQTLFSGFSEDYDDKLSRQESRERRNLRK